MKPLDDWMRVEQEDAASLYDPSLQDFEYKVLEVGSKVTDIEPGQTIACPGYTVQDHKGSKFVRRKDVFGVTSK